MTLQTITFDPAEWRLMPLKLTDDMYEARDIVLADCDTIVSGRQVADAIYKAWLSAAPTPPPMQATSDEVARLRRDCADAYQIVGYFMDIQRTDPAPSLDDIVRALDNLSAAANGTARPHDDLLPWPRQTQPPMQAAGQWRPLNEYAFDGTPVLAFKRGGYSEWLSWNREAMLEYWDAPTHWMPLPAAPSTPAGER